MFRFAREFIELRFSSTHLRHQLLFGCWSFSPPPLPLIGNMHQLGYKMFVRKIRSNDAIREWAKEYGSVFTIWIGPMATVNICDYTTAVDSMVKKGSAFADRSIPYIFRLVRNDKGIIASNGAPWLEQRRFALHTLRNFGLGRNLIEQRIMFEFEIACERLGKRLDAGEKSIDPHRIFDLLVGNIINRMLFGERFEKKDEEHFFALKEELDDATKRFTIFDSMVDEWNVHWPLIKQRTRSILHRIEPVVAFIRGQVEKRKREIENGSRNLQGEGDDYVDAFLIQMKKERESGAPTSFDDEMLIMALFDMWLAGQETTVATLGWAFSYLLLNPEVRSRLEQELFMVTKGQRPLSIVDRPNTPYYNAVIAEVHRCASIVPLNLWRDTSEDSIVGPFVIPKGTAITAQLSLIMTDEKHFLNPSQFNPDRYLNGNKLDQMVIPFGLGKRSCLGESLAQAELFLIIGNVLLEYNVSSDPHHMPTTRSRNEAGTLRKPQAFHICFERR